MTSRYLKAKLKGLSDEEKVRKIRELMLEEKLEALRANVLKRYRDECEGTFYAGRKV